ncbi:hypothetical protein Syun_011922 [Stephania yunnanensis]|uniref:Uncharacterized protein n=1 Tax=Stephania yunnanensis TaxID=152371 RepID=A0AAP0PFX6_9MAGN
MVDASRDIDVKLAPKKSHNLLSGMGSKVKHSIAKVKKAITGNLRRSLSVGSLLPFDPEIEKTCRRNSKVTQQRNQSSRVQLNEEQPFLMADHIGNPHAPIAPHERQEEPIVIPPRQFVVPAGPYAPVEQQRHDNVLKIKSMITYASTGRPSQLRYTEDKWTTNLHADDGGLLKLDVVEGSMMKFLYFYFSLFFGKAGFSFSYRSRGNGFIAFDDEHVVDDLFHLHVKLILFLVVVILVLIGLQCLGGRRGGYSGGNELGGGYGGFGGKWLRCLSSHICDLVRSPIFFSSVDLGEINDKIKEVAPLDLDNNNEANNASSESSNEWVERSKRKSCAKERESDEYKNAEKSNERRK